MYEPQNLKRWKMPSNYFGEVWPDYYSSGVGQSRDSDCLEESNFAAMLKELGGESETVIVVRESHWAVGWIEWIAIHATDDTALKIADDLKSKLDDYPILNEDDFSEREWNHAADFWDSLSPRDKVKMAMDARKRYHWLQKESVWRFGRMDYSALANDGTTISEALYESLRD